MTQDSRVAVIGLGYVGLPMAVAFVEAGLSVEGIDAFAGRVAELNARTSPIDDISDERLGAALDAGLRVVSPEDARMGEADVVFVCVPTPITATKDPDLAPVLAAAESIRRQLRPGQLIILQSTTFPGTTTGPFREVIERSGLTAGSDFDLAFAPERVNPGDPASASKGVPRLVGATTPEASRRAAAVLANINDEVIQLSSPDAAELAKLLENVFRNINIAFVNQLALLCERMGLDVWEIINAAATKPFGFMKFTPGPGVGGHCIPVDPYYLSWRAREFDFIDRFVEAAADINFSMPRHVVEPGRPGAQRSRPGAEGCEGRRARRRLQAERPGCPELARQGCPGRHRGARRRRPFSRSPHPHIPGCGRTGPREHRARRTAGLGRCDRGRDRTQGDRLVTRLRACRPRRRHR